MGIVNNLSNELSTVFNAMAKKQIVDQQLKDIIVATFATPAHLNKLSKEDAKVTRFETLVSDVYAYANNSDTQQMATTKGTVFGAYNAITGYLQNVKEWDNKGAQVAGTLLNTGAAYELTQKAFNQCIQLL